MMLEGRQIIQRIMFSSKAKNNAWKTELIWISYHEQNSTQYFCRKIFANYIDEYGSRKCSNPFQK